MASATGTATINLGGLPGLCEAAIGVSGQAAISATSHAEAFIMGDSTADHPAADHIWLKALGVSVTCGVPTAGVGFTIYIRSTFELSGHWTFRWVWSD